MATGDIAMFVARELVTSGLIKFMVVFMEVLIPQCHQRTKIKSQWRTWFCDKMVRTTFFRAYYKDLVCACHQSTHEPKNGLATFRRVLRLPWSNGENFFERLETFPKISFKDPLKLRELRDLLSELVCQIWGLLAWTFLLRYCKVGQPYSCLIVYKKKG